MPKTAEEMAELRKMIGKKKHSTSEKREMVEDKSGDKEVKDLKKTVRKLTKELKACKK
jgi:hypothetical protein